MTLQRMRFPAFGFVMLVVLPLLAAGCSNTAVAPTAFAPFSQRDLQIGSGAEAVSGKTVTVNYTGWLYSPTDVDNKGPLFATTLGSTPFAFTLGTNQVIAGWDRGVPGMQEGGTRRLIIPPSLAYGSSRNGPIPPNATLVFDITVITVQ